MKTIKRISVIVIVIVTILLFYISGTSLVFSQHFTDSVCFNNDTVSIVRVTAENGYFADYLLYSNLESGDFYFDFIENTPATGESSEFLKENIWLPGPDGGVLPDVMVYNPDAEKVYVAGMRRLSIIDKHNNTLINTLDVTEYGHSIPHFLLMSLNYKKIVYDEVAKRVFYSTMGNELVCINGTTNEIDFTETDEVKSQLSSGLVFDPVNNRLFWLLNFWDGTSKLIQRDFNAGTSANRLFNEQIFDIELDQDGQNCYIAINTRIEKLDPQTLNTTGQNTIGLVTALEYDKVNNRIYGIDINEKTSLRVIDASGLSYTTINLNTEFSIVTQSASRQTPDATRVYFTGTVSAGSDLLSFDCNTGEYEVISTPDRKYCVAFNDYNDHVYWGGTTISGYNLNNQQVYLASLILDRSNCTGLITDDNGYVLSGSFFEGLYQSLPPGLQTIEDRKALGMISLHGCSNPDFNKVYFLQSIYGGLLHYTKSLVSINDEDGDHIASVEAGPTLTSCVYNGESQEVFIASYDDKVIQVLDGEDDLITESIWVRFHPLFMETIGSKVYCAGDGGFAIIDAQTHSMQETFFGMDTLCLAIGKDPKGERIFISMYYSVPVIMPTMLVVIDHNTGSYKIKNLMERWAFDIEYNDLADNIYLALSVEGQIMRLDYDGNIIEYIDLDFEPKYLAWDKYKNNLYVYGANGLQGRLSAFNCENFTQLNSMDLYRCEGLTFNNRNDQLYLHQVTPAWDNNSATGIYSLDGLYIDVSGKTGLVNKIACNFPLSYLAPLPDFVKNYFNGHGNLFYAANWGFSNASIMVCNTDWLKLKGDWTWLSLPRLERRSNDPFSSVTALNQRIDPWVEGYIYMRDKLGNSVYYTDYWYTNGLETVESTEGYKLFVEWAEGPPPQLQLIGAKLEPETMLHLEGDESNENWVGYFLEDPAWYWECIPADLLNNHIWEIRTQYWSMVRTCPPPQGFCWVFDGSVQPFRYGDMVIIRIDEDADFSWVQGGDGDGAEERPAPQNFTYGEQADYIPYFIEFDSGSTVQEIGVFADGECKGAAVRLPGDTIVEVNGYLEGTAAGATIEFQTYDGYKSSTVSGNDYLVFNPRRQAMERRTLYAGEKARYQIISFNCNEGYNIPENLAETGCRPNPFTNSATITFRISEPMPVWIEILGQDGRIINTLAGGEHNGGYYEYSWNGADQAGRNMPVGIYFWRIRSGSGEQAVGKVVKIGESRQ